MNEANIDAPLAAMEILDTRCTLAQSSEQFAFKHALLHDALYESLLNETRAMLHAKIAAEIERRSQNLCLAEGQPKLSPIISTKPDRFAKAFTYLSIAGQ